MARRLSVFVLILATVVGAEDYSRAKKYYDSHIGRPSLQMRTRGRVALAKTDDRRAVEILSASYSRPNAAKDQERYLIISIAAEYCIDNGHVPLYDAWRKRHTRFEDAWLWYKALVMNVDALGADAAQAVALGKDNVFVRAAAVRALGASIEPYVLPIIPKLLGALPQKSIERAVIIESCAAALLAQQEHLGTEEYRAAALKLMRMLDLKETPEHAKKVVARHFAKLFKTDKVITNSSKPWRNALLHGELDLKEEEDRYARKKPTFVGIEATGTRICYVIDMSDSMLTPLTPREKEILKGPITGRSTKKKKGEEGFLGESDLNWKKIKNRFDCAREYLKLSLRGLDEEKRFAVILFGSKASFLKSAHGLVKATKGAVEKACRELDGVRPGPKGQNRPHGTLLGYTNMHGGIHRAFKLKGKGSVKKYEYVHPATFKGGCDTIFLLSDGDPTWDDWPDTDQPDPNDRAGDPESGALMNTKPNRFKGPYARNWFLLDDVRRLNLFRHVELHCIGIGEAKRGFLQQIARTGLGKTKFIGATKGKPRPSKKKRK